MTKQYQLLATVLVVAALCACFARAALIPDGHMPEPIEELTRNAPGLERTFKTVHVIAHTHDDPGFVKTYQEYFYGAENRITWAGVRYILDTVVQELLANEFLKFVYSETVFFSKWFEDLPANQQEIARGLINKGQLQIAGGGWVMNDDACTYYEDIIDQMTIGHQYLKLRFNMTPSVGWQIDPFGQSQAQTYFFDEMGYNAWFFCRVELEDHLLRLWEQNMEFVWHSSQNTSTFTSIPFFQYGSPPNYDFDIKGRSNPIVDDPESPLYNLEPRAVELVDFLHNVSMRYRGNETYYTFGGDFQYGDARVDFMNQQLLFNYINSQPERFKMKIIYSTPNDYIAAVHKQGVQYPRNDYDFFPYRDLPYMWWTGFYTTRPALKGMEMDYGRYLQSVRNMLLLPLVQDGGKRGAQLVTQRVVTAIEKLEQAVGIVQHHDAITGTCKQHVANDYYRILQAGMNKCNAGGVFPTVSALTTETTGEPAQQYVRCNWNYTASDCTLVYNRIEAHANVLVSVYNPLPHDAPKKVISFRVPREAQYYQVIARSGEAVRAELVCANLTDTNDCKVYFQADLTALSLHHFKLAFAPGAPQQKRIIVLEMDNLTDFEASFSVGSRTLTVFPGNQTFIYMGKDRFQLAWMYYPSDQSRLAPSGMYIFRPVAENNAGPSAYSQIVGTYAFRGQIVVDILLWGDKTSSEVTMFGDEDALFLDTFVNSIDVSDGRGKEIVMQVNTAIQNEGVFYTDSNGLEFQKRVYGKRPNYIVLSTAQAASNYYPLALGIAINDTKTGAHAFLMTDRSEGGSSLVNGQIEVMIHRRLLNDDGKGVGEALNETNLWNKSGLFQRVRHRLLFAKNETQIRALQYARDLHPEFWFAATYSGTFPPLGDAGHEHDVARVGALNLPPLVKFYLKWWYAGVLVLRLQNLDPQATVSVDGTQFTIIEETTMTGNQNYATWQKNRLKWNEEPAANAEEPQRRKAWQVGDTTIELKPFQIRTFLIQVPADESIENWAKRVI